jgi:hypothetical protein
VNFDEESNRQCFSNIEGDDHALLTPQKAYEIKLLTVRKEGKTEETRKPTGAMC